MKTTRAFTLIELLIVVAIIGVLIAILVPILGRARSSAKSSACQSNLRQIGTAINAYASKHQAIPVTDYWYSPEYGSSWNGGGGNQNFGCNLSWPERLIDDGDIGNISQKNQWSHWAAGVFVCPSHDPAYQFGFGTDPGVEVQHFQGGTQGPNAFVHYDTNVWDGYGLNPYMTGQKLGNVTPTHILAADGCGIPITGYGGRSGGVRGVNPDGSPGGPDESGPVDWQNLPKGYSGPGVYPRHPGGQTYPYPTFTVNGNVYQRIPQGANYLFGDGHVEWSILYGHISMVATQGGAGVPYGIDRPPPFNYWLNP